MSQILLIVNSATPELQVLDEGQRQLVLLALAELALSRPGWDATLGDLAEQFKGRSMFDRFKTVNADRVKETHQPLGPAAPMLREPGDPV